MKHKIKIQKIFRTDFIVKSIDQSEPYEHTHIESQAEYDIHGNQISETSFDASGNQIEKYVWVFNDKLKVVEDYFSGVDELSEHTEFLYDDKNRLVLETKTFVDGLIQKTTYSYDEDKICSIVVSDSDEGETSKRILSYADNGKTIIEKFSEYDENQIETETTKDDDGNIIYRKQNRLIDDIITEEFMTFKNELLTEYRKRESFADEIIHQYTYNENNQLIEVNTLAGESKSKVNIEFDEKGNPIKEIETDGEGNIANSVERLYYPETGLAHTTKVSISRNRYGAPEHYNLEYQYELRSEN